MGPRDGWNGRHQQHRRDDHSVRVQSGSCARHGHADLQYDDPPGLQGLSGRPRHLHPERRRHRRELALRRDRRLRRGQDQGHLGRAYASPLVPSTPGPSARYQVPFAGVYTAFTKGGFFLDGQVRWDFYQNSLVGSSQRPVRPAPQRARLLADRQRRLQHAAGQRLVHRAIGRRRLVARESRSAQRGRACRLPGSAVCAAGPSTIDDIDSLLGRASLRVGTNFTSGGVAWQPFFTASVFHEFAGDVTAIVDKRTGDASLDVASICRGAPRRRAASAPMVSSPSARPPRSSIPGGSAMRASTTASARTSKAGASTPACAISSRPARSAAASRTARRRLRYAYNWTGPYIGAYAGTTWGDEALALQSAPAHAYEPDFAGYLVGGQAGYNVQLGRSWSASRVTTAASNANGGKSCPNSSSSPAKPRSTVWRL